MVSRFMDFALKKSGNGNENNTGASSQDDEDTDERLQAELALLFGDSINKPKLEASFNSSSNFSSASTFNNYNDFSTRPLNVATENLSVGPITTSGSQGGEENNDEDDDEEGDAIPDQYFKPAYKTIDVTDAIKKLAYEQLEIEKQRDKEAEKMRQILNPVEEDLSKPYKCEECGTRVKAKSTLELHISTQHKKIKSFACTLCDHKAAQRANLVVHMKGTHNQTEKFQCNFCTKTEDSKRQIGNHIQAEHGKSVYGRGKTEDYYTPIYVTFIENKFEIC